ncbi:MAG: mechanosensitive ion channel family protein [Eubacteriales bacterium]|nr:mechanosensitive ion channel family protein [Eubacteriales bacterium]
MKTITNFFSGLSEMKWLVIIFEAAFLLALTYVAVRLINRAFDRTKNPRNLNLKFLKSFLTGLVWVIGIVQIIALIPGMSNFTQTVLAGSGIVAVVIGLAAQESFGNLISGMIIAIFHPFQVGDRVHLLDNDITGWIEDITLRHTIIRTFTNSRIIIPNSEMSKEKIENADFSDSGASAVINVSVAYESDLEKAMKIMARAIGDHPLFYDTRTEEQKAAGVEKVRVFVEDFGDSGIVLRASMWTKTIAENFGACSDARLEIKKAFEREGIEIPYNKIVVLEK